MSETATQEAKTTPKVKDLADVAKVSELNGLGWRVEGGDNAFTAYKEGSDDPPIGPAKSIKALHTQVMLKASDAPPKTHKVDRSKVKGNKAADSQPILTGTEDAVFADLKNAGVAYRKTTMEILRLQKIQSTQRDALKPLLEKFRDQLEFGTDSNGKEEYFLVVDVEGDLIDIVLAKKEVESLETRKHNS